jgi:lysophospholipase L1-like esterase
MIIFIYGDSITQGAWDTAGGWANRIKTYFINDAINKNFKGYSQAINLGVDGDTTKKLLNRFNNETRARIWPNQENAFVFAIGINDTMVTNNKNKSTPMNYALELESLLEQASQYANKIAFVNSTPVDEPSANVVINPANHECFYNSRTDEFNNVLQKFCEQNSLPLIDVNSEFKAKDYKELLADGVHPNSDGHEIIYNAVLPIVQEWTS